MDVKLVNFKSDSAHEREWRSQHCSGSARQRGAGSESGEAGGGGVHPARSEQVKVSLGSVQTHIAFVQL